jgi:hypothetical protein
MLLYSLTVLWFAQHGYRLYTPVARPWYRHKVRPSPPGTAPRYPSGCCGGDLIKSGRVAPGDCSPGAPTDPDVRNSRIRLFVAWFRREQTTVPPHASAGSAPAPLSVEVPLTRCLGLSVPTVFLSDGSMLRRPLPSTGFAWVRSPASSVVRGAPTPCRSSCTASFPSPWQYHRHPSFALRQVGRPSSLSQGCSPASPTGLLSWKRQGLPGSWATLCGRAPLFDPGETERSGPFNLPMRPSAVSTASALATSSFRGSMTRPAHSLSTLRSPGYPSTTQDSLPAGGLLCRAGFAPAGLLVKFPLYIASSSPKLCLAHRNSN